MRITLSEDTRKKLEAKAKACQDLTPVFRRIGLFAVREMQRRFYDGKITPPSRRAIRENGKTLLDTGRLAQSITYVATHNTMMIGTNVSYAAQHQEGLNGLPVRKFLIMTKEIADFTKATIAEAIAKA